MTPLLHINDGPNDAAHVRAHLNNIFNVIDTSDSFDGRIHLGLLGFVDLEFDFVTGISVANAGSIHKTCITLGSKMKDVNLSGLIGRCTVQIGVLESGVQDSGGSVWSLTAFRLACSSSDLIMICWGPQTWFDCICCIGGIQLGC